MRSFIIILVLIILSLQTEAQEWKRFYGQPYISLSYSIHEMYDKGFVTAGLIRDETGPFSGYIFKTGINGELIWQKVISEISDTYLLYSELTQDNGIICGGAINFDNRNSAYVIKFNACFEVEWCRIFPETDNCDSEISGIKQMDDGSFICSRYKYSGDQHYRWSLIRLSKEGDMIWSNYYDLNSSYWSQIDMIGLLGTLDNCVVITSSVYDTIDEEGYLSEMPYWYKVDIDGNLLWDTKWNLIKPYSPAEARFTTEDLNGNYYSGGFISPWKSSQLYKLSHEGDTISRYYMNDSPPAISGAQINTLHFISPDSLLMSGQAWDTPEGNHWTLQITDTIGNIINRIYEKEQIAFGNIIITKDNKILLVGVTFSYPDHENVIALYKFNMNLEYDSIYTAPRTYDSLCSHAIVSDTIPMPGNCRVVSSPKPDKLGDVQALVLSPNPATSYVSVGIPEFYASTGSFALGKVQQFRPLTGKVQLIMYNLAGNKVFEESLDASDKNHSIDVSSYPAGMYMLQLSRQNKTVATGKLVIVK